MSERLRKRLLGGHNPVQVNVRGQGFNDAGRGVGLSTATTHENPRQNTHGKSVVVV